MDAAASCDRIEGGTVTFPDCAGETGFLCELPPACLAKVRGLLASRHYAPGTTIFDEGTFHDDLHIVVSGHVRLDMRVPGKGRIPILTAGPGDVLAWSAVVGDQIMTTSAVALEAVETQAIAGPALRAACEADHELGYQVMQLLAAALSRRLVATRLQLLDLFSRS